MCEAVGIRCCEAPSGGTVSLSSEQHNIHWHQKREASPSALSVKERKTPTWAWLGGVPEERVSAGLVEWQGLDRLGCGRGSMHKRQGYKECLKYMV